VSDNNGTGAPRTVQLDVSALGAFSTATQLIIDAATDVSSGPLESSIPVADQMTVTLNGYGVEFIKLNP
jgi:hypothetical protein